jgi:hypothetical protein
MNFVLVEFDLIGKVSGGRQDAGWKRPNILEETVAELRGAGEVTVRPDL